LSVSGMRNTEKVSLSFLATVRLAPLIATYPL